jgi:hypothetical protein
MGPIPVTSRSKAWIYPRSVAGIVGLNPDVGMDIFLSRVFFVTVRSLRRADHSSRGVLLEVMCDREGWKRRRLWPTRGHRVMEKIS